ncbi:MAG: xanthine dehydrogenase accessory factor [Solirubrobacteraceae bacterium]|jgi:xanthine dehydrogenase accessory factor|nr:xanthine dehydrogenase accessory factor [Solirubrobacteraceae bacterium]
MISRALADRSDALAAERVPFVVATVVRAQHPTSVHAGDAALVLGDGTIEGFVGGMCAQESVRLHALRVLETGEALLLRIVPEGGEDPGDEGAITVANPCLSGGALELFLEPRMPPAQLVVLGDTPVALALADLGHRVGFAVATGREPAPHDAAVVVASHGHDEEQFLQEALRHDVPYVGLVASHRRGDAVLASLDVDEALRERVHTPAGLDIGARSAEEIAVSILAEIIASRGERPAAAAAGSAPASRPAPARTAVDPVCHMEVVVTDATPTVDGRFFCCTGCRDAYAADPERYATAS